MLTINEDCDIVHKYMAILELRYNLNFDLETSVSKAAGRERIPACSCSRSSKMRFSSGFVPVNKNGVIRITAELYGEDMLELVIADDGRGMSKSRLEKYGGRCTAATVNGSASASCTLLKASPSITGAGHRSTFSAGKGKGRRLLCGCSRSVMRRER